ncbi:hypothetical protein G5V59_20440 [Nocardioides sp. W3-2-3]|uniref:hypothetical protein n=1 Tax=Nocardioides convexus TaxID=2712224 RepID=UPI002418A0A0|nr:hypothetical protein [Nocardioides convexus]NHA01403.1 hypothetical protein [Nocardioides convexus]
MAAGSAATASPVPAVAARARAKPDRDHRRHRRGGHHRAHRRHRAAQGGRWRQPGERREGLPRGAELRGPRLQRAVRACCRRTPRRRLLDGADVKDCDAYADKQQKEFDDQARREGSTAPATRRSRTSRTTSTTTSRSRRPTRPATRPMSTSSSTSKFTGDKKILDDCGGDDDEESQDGTVKARQGGRRLEGRRHHRRVVPCAPSRSSCWSSSRPCSPRSPSRAPG